jgi:hypothetical protein
MLSLSFALPGLGVAGYRKSPNTRSAIMKDKKDIEKPRLTIVGGQPQRPLVGGSIGKRARFSQKVEVPVGVEKILYLAAKNADIKKKLLEDRKAAIADLGVQLRPSEQAMLEATPKTVLAAMIARLEPESPRKRRFMQVVAAVATSLAAGTAVIDCSSGTSKGVGPGVTFGIGPDIDTDTDTDSDTDTDADADTDIDSGPGDDAGLIDASVPDSGKEK